MKAEERKYLERALQLAHRAEGVSLPNPMVGAVIVAPDGRIIGEGFTAECGCGHAEVNAVNSVADSDRQLLSRSTVYVTLEPCSHYGKTPPCAKLLCDIAVSRVVVGTVDSFSKVSGRGIEMLHEAGIKVEMAPEDIAERCRWINRKFFKAHSLKRPYISLKWARSADGWLDRQRSAQHPEPASISTAVGKFAVHRLRAVNDAILVGSGTVLADRPRLDCRLSGGKNPLPVVLDVRRRLGVELLEGISRKPLLIDYDADLATYMSDLYKHGITSVLVEGGADTLQRFIDAGLWDEIREEVSPEIFGALGQTAAPIVRQLPYKRINIGSNYVNFYVSDLAAGVKNL